MVAKGALAALYPGLVRPGRFSGSASHCRIKPQVDATEASSACRARLRAHHPSTQAKTRGATIDASDSMMNFGVESASFPQVIFSLGTAPEYEP